MKRMLTIVLTATFMCLLLFPNLSYSEVRAGLKVGLTSANLHGDNVDDYEKWIGKLNSKLGFCAGGFVTFNLHDIFAIQPELLFTMKGAKVDEQILGKTLEAWVNLNYLEIPVLIKLLIPTQGSIKPNLFIGPALGIKLTGKVKAEYAGETEEEELEDLKSTDIGMVFGGGVDFGLGKGFIVIDFRYTLGLATISDFEDDDVKNGVFSLMLGYSF